MAMAMTMAMTVPAAGCARASRASSSRCSELEELVMNLERHQVDRVVPTVKHWIRRGNLLTSPRLHGLICRLRSRRRYLQALMAMDWVANERVIPFSYHEAIQRLDLCSRCHHVTRTLLLFQALPHKWKTEEAYCVLLAMYYARDMVEAADKAMEELRAIGIQSLEPYHLMLSLYKQREMETRFERMVTEIRGSGLTLDRSFFAILMAARDSFGGCVTSMEDVLAEMEDRGVALDAVGHLTVAGIYIRHGLRHKSEQVLHELESSLDSGEFKDLKTTQRKMLAMFGKLGDGNAVGRIWRVMDHSRTANTMEDFVCGIEAFGRTERMDEAENIYMRVGCNSSNPRPHNAFLNGLVEHGDVARAEALVERMKGVRCPWTPVTYHLLIKIYLKTGSLNRAMLTFERLRSAFQKQERPRPSPETLVLLVDSFAATGDVQASERLVNKWMEDGFPMSVKVFNALLKVYVKAGVGVDDFPARMLSAGVEPTRETEVLTRQTL